MPDPRAPSSAPRARPIAKSLFSRALDLARSLLCRCGQVEAPRRWAGTQSPEGAMAIAPRGTTMAMDLWYELRIREMSDVNEAANELLRDAKESASGSPDQEAEE